MKFVRLTTLYPRYLEIYESRNPDTSEQSYAEQKARLDSDSYGWADFWSKALSPLGYEAQEVNANVESLQRSWAKENQVSFSEDNWVQSIAHAQILKAKPDVLFMNENMFSAQWLRNLRKECPSIRLVLGWVGSALPKRDIWSEVDLILSCAPESVEQLTRMGRRSEHLNHAFAPQILEKTKPEAGKYELSFIGQIVRGAQFHLERERLLKNLVNQVDLSIFSDSADVRPFSPLELLARRGLYSSTLGLRALGVKQETLQRLPAFKKSARWTELPIQPVDRVLQKRVRPAVYGLDMYNTIASSKMTLNIHADSSPRFVSNMRLFETSGMGSCQLVDWRPNISDYFVPDKEVVTYRTAEECLEKVSWLRDHPEEREEIARAGQKRCLSDHTFARRAPELDRLIRKYL